jgi:hypothetical protein
MIINHTDLMLMILRFKTAFLNFTERQSQGENSRTTLLNSNFIFISNYVMSGPRKFYFERILFMSSAVVMK